LISFDPGILKMSGFLVAFFVFCVGCVLFLLGVGLRDFNKEWSGHPLISSNKDWTFLQRTTMGHSIEPTPIIQSQIQCLFVPTVQVSLVDPVYGSSSLSSALLLSPHWQLTKTFERNGQSVL
jgi:hypothetical protein